MQMQIDRDQVGQADKFYYLGVIFQKKEKYEIDLKNRKKKIFFNSNNKSNKNKYTQLYKDQ